jgi:hypothetical protein
MCGILNTTIWEDWGNLFTQSYVQKMKMIQVWKMTSSKWSPFLNSVTHPFPFQDMFHDGFEGFPVLVQCPVSYDVLLQLFQGSILQLFHSSQWNTRYPKLTETFSSRRSRILFNTLSHSFLGLIDYDRARSPSSWKITHCSLFFTTTNHVSKCVHSWCISHLKMSAICFLCKNNWHMTLIEGFHNLGMLCDAILLCNQFSSSDLWHIWKRKKTTIRGIMIPYCNPSVTFGPPCSVQVTYFDQANRIKKKLFYKYI